MFSLTIAQRCRSSFPLDSSGIRIILRRGSQMTTLMEERSDVFLNFADVAWLDGGNVVVLKACTSGPRVEIAYDLKSNAFVAFNHYRSALARHIVQKYGLSSRMSDSDVYDWACTDTEPRRSGEKRPMKVG